ncbi:MAG: aspartate kinase [Clostridiales bacterium]|nr:aspartate kinase [Clostridiales bacterium]
MKKLIIQKFGGTSLSSKERRNAVVHKILKARDELKSVVVVVSAMGRNGDPYATDTLKNLIKNSGCSLKNIDLIMSCGEIISATVLAAMLESASQTVTVLTGFQAGILTNDNFSNSEILSIDKNKITSHLMKDEIVIVCGFQGVTKNNEITTLGRGGSDTTAAALGVALEAECVEIYTDVDGIMTADPNVVSSAKIIDELNYNEVYQMADTGAKVIHPKAVEIAQKGNILLKIKNTMSSHPGTYISANTIIVSNPNLSEINDTLLTAITQKDNISQVTISVDENAIAESELFSSLAKANISLDMITLFITKKIFTIDDIQVNLLKGILDASNTQYKILDNCSKITIIGNKITGIPGVMARILSTFSKNNIQILQTSDSHSTISCLVHTKNATLAVNVLHDAFGLSL